MSQHASLRCDSVGTKHRNVLKRFERIKKLQEVGKWGDRASIYNLPKVKSLKIKVKKIKEPKDQQAPIMPSIMDQFMRYKDSLRTMRFAGREKQK